MPPRLARWLWLLAVPIGIGMAAEGTERTAGAWRLWSEGVEREAVVIARDVETRRRSTIWDRRAERHIVTYDILLDGRPVRQSHGVTAAFYESLAPDDRIPVRTTLAPPILSEIERRRRLHDGLVFVLGGIVVAGLGLLVFLESVPWRQ